MLSCRMSRLTPSSAALSAKRIRLFPCQSASPTLAHDPAPFRRLVSYIPPSQVRTKQIELSGSRSSRRTQLSGAPGIALRASQPLTPIESISFARLPFNCLRIYLLREHGVGVGYRYRSHPISGIFLRVRSACEDSSPRYFVNPASVAITALALLRSNPLSAIFLTL
jgi:hypothetical protein